MRKRIQSLLIPLLAVLLIVFSVGFLIGRNAAQNDTVIQVSRKPTPEDAAVEMASVGHMPSSRRNVGFSFKRPLVNT